MHAVVIAELASPIDAEAAALAADLGTTAYEERLKLAAGLPSVVLTSADPAPARSLHDKLRARGHLALVVADGDVVSSAAMVSTRRFAFEPDALTAPDTPGARLPYADILGLFRAMHASRTQSTNEVKSKQFSMGRAIVTGGLVMSKTVSKEQTTISAEREQLCYLFRASGQTPWILRERGTQYAGLGRDLTPSSAQNFLATIARLRVLAPQAVYDERLMNARGAPNRASRGAGDSFSISSGSGVDLLAHVLALTAAEKRAARR